MYMYKGKGASKCYCYIMDAAKLNIGLFSCHSGRIAKNYKCALNPKPKQYLPNALSRY